MVDHPSWMRSRLGQASVAAVAGASPWEDHLASCQVETAGVVEAFA